MELSNEFTVRLPVEETWALLTDLERIAPCMPGAQLQEIEGDEHRGVVKVKVGPITAQYKGVASFVERDETAHVAVLKAEGRDTRGQGNASALITATVTGKGDSSHVRVVTDLTVTGKVAQFGRNVLADVSAKLLDQFVERLEADLVRVPVGSQAADANADRLDATQAARTITDSRVLRRLDAPPSEPIDLLAAAGPDFLKRIAGVAALVFVATLLLRRRRPLS